jgi:putative tryptophan/tyrosine transport system substrate-binding protein
MGQFEEMTMWCNTVGCILLLTLSLLATPLATEAQPTRTVPRIGVLVPGVPPKTPGDVLAGTGLERFRQGLRELGYVEDQTIALEVRWDAHHPERWPDLAAALVHLPVDLLVVGTTTAALAAKHATSTIPIVMAVSADPVGDGLVASLARPGGNITGLSNLTPELTGKRLELLTAAVPGLARVALLLDARNPSRHAQRHDSEAAARVLGVELLPLEVQGPDEFAGAFQAALQGHTQALVVQVSPLFGAHRGRLAELALASRLPTMAGNAGYAKAGGLMNYGASFDEMWHRAATYVDKILKGAWPGDLPVEQPTKFELVLNLKTAQALRITMPPSLLLLADEVIQ